MTVHRGGVKWRKSSRSGDDTSCVELANTGSDVRDSKNRAGRVLSARELPEFVRLVKTGRFDR